MDYDVDEVPNHAEVLEAGKKASKYVLDIVTKFVGKIDVWNCYGSKKNITFLAFFKLGILKGRFVQYASLCVSLVHIIM